MLPAFHDRLGRELAFDHVDTSWSHADSDKLTLVLVRALAHNALFICNLTVSKSINLLNRERERQQQRNKMEQPRRRR